jgi:hypothetical protein
LLHQTDQLATELENLKIGEKAATWYQQEIKRVRELLTPMSSNGHPAKLPTVAQLIEGQLEEVDEPTWKKFAESYWGTDSAGGD